jgi:hypothetical protein
MKYALVTTTINVPKLLKDYAEDFRKNNHKVAFYIVADKNTPDKAKNFCLQLGHEYEDSIEMNYFDVYDQNSYMTRYPELNDHIPWNCIQRRNVGILKAYEEGNDAIITIDDDNFLAENDYIGLHGLIGDECEIDVYSSNSNWLNICDFLRAKNNSTFFARGFPLQQRSNYNAIINKVKKKARVVVNGGFWLGDPDVDAVTRLAAPPDVIEYKLQNNFALDRGTWSPFNSQNTALHRDTIPAYFLSPFVGRFDDIWASYIVKAVADHLGDLISFGHPLVKQRRNDHNLWHDFDLEKMGLQMTDVFCDWLLSCKFKGENYTSCTLELIDHIRICLEREKGVPEEYRIQINYFIKGYFIWQRVLNICSRS